MRAGARHEPAPVATPTAEHHRGRGRDVVRVRAAQHHLRHRHSAPRSRYVHYVCASRNTLLLLFCAYLLCYVCTSRDVISGFWGGIGVGCVGCLLVEVVVVAMTAAVTARVTRKAFVINIGTTAYTLFSR